MRFVFERIWENGALSRYAVTANLVLGQIYKEHNKLLCKSKYLQAVYTVLGGNHKANLRCS